MKVAFGAIIPLTALISRRAKAVISFSNCCRTSSSVAWGLLRPCPSPPSPPPLFEDHWPLQPTTAATARTTTHVLSFCFKTFPLLASSCLLPSHAPGGSVRFVRRIRAPRLQPSDDNKRGRASCQADTACQ